MFQMSTLSVSLALHGSIIFSPYVLVAYLAVLWKTYQLFIALFYTAYCCFEMFKFLTICS